MTGQIGRDVLEAAAAEGVAPDGPLGRLVAALAALGDRFDAKVDAALMGASLHLDRRLEALETAREGAEAAAETARLAVADHKVRADAALVELVDGITEQIGPATKDWRVIKARIHGAQRIGLVAGLGALAAVALLGAGAGLVAWLDRDAVRFHSACARELVFDAQGKGYCPVYAVVERRPTT